LADDMDGLSDANRAEGQRGVARIRIRGRVLLRRRGLRLRRRGVPPPPRRRVQGSTSAALPAPLPGRRALDGGLQRAQRDGNTPGRRCGFPCRVRVYYIWDRYVEAHGDLSRVDMLELGKTTLKVWAAGEERTRAAKAAAMETARSAALCLLRTSRSRRSDASTRSGSGPLHPLLATRGRLPPRPAPREGKVRTVAEWMGARGQQHAQSWG
jgi:hypothetical protein